MKLWSSVRQQANKLAFEADRMMRIKKEESAIDDARKQISNVTTSIGQVALGLFRAGSLDVPQVAALVKQIDEIEATIAQRQQAIDDIKAEAAPAAEGKEAPAAEAPQAPLEPAQRAAAVAPVEEQAAPEAEEPAAPGRKCPNCGADAPETGAFCPECGARLE